MFFIWSSIVCIIISCTFSNRKRGRTYFYQRKFNHGKYRFTCMNYFNTGQLCFHFSWDLSLMPVIRYLYLCQVADIHLCLPINRELVYMVLCHFSTRLAAHCELCLKIFFFPLYANAHVGVIKHSSWHMENLSEVHFEPIEHIVMISPAPYSF